MMSLIDIPPVAILNGPVAYEYLALGTSLTRYLKH